jgi:pSer/pThr/pTyr-binding forkhead associated (FHA) protein
MPFCTACGNHNPDDANFCSQCGTRMAAPLAPSEAVGETTATISIGLGGDKSETSDRQLNAVDAAAVDALTTGHALLVVQKGPGSGSRFLLDVDVVRAGRHPDSEIFLDDVTVSRHHAEFARDGATFVVSDAGSLNGTYVNRDRIDRILLKDGDEVQIGKYRLVFFSGHEDL